MKESKLVHWSDVTLRGIPSSSEQSKAISLRKSAPNPLIMYFFVRWSCRHFLARAQWLLVTIDLQSCRRFGVMRYDFGLLL